MGIVFDFSWDIFMLQEKLQTMVMQKSWGVIEVYYGSASSECKQQFVW